MELERDPQPLPQQKLDSRSSDKTETAILYGGTLKCVTKVVLERNGRKDIASSYEWESRKLDWWLASNLNQIELNEVAFRLKLHTWRNRNPYLNSESEQVPEVQHRWVRPEFAGADEKTNGRTKWHSVVEPTLNYLSHRNRMLCFILPVPLAIVFIACLVCHFIEWQ